jgi:hypothetical protein
MKAQKLLPTNNILGITHIEVVSLVVLNSITDVYMWANMDHM